MGASRGVDEEVLDRLADYDRDDAHRFAARALDLVELERYAKGRPRRPPPLTPATAGAHLRPTGMP
jgi:hypothetical protein